jgi:hypothetical protein
MLLKELIFVQKLIVDMELNIDQLRAYQLNLNTYYEQILEQSRKDLIVNKFASASCLQEPRINTQPGDNGLQDMQSLN